MNAPAEHWNGPIREYPDDGRRITVKSLLGAALGILLSLSLLASAGFFYIAIQRDEAVTAQCMRAVESIRATQMLASQWSVEVGKVKNEVNSNFDVLADFVDRMAPHIQLIHSSQNAMPDLPSDVKWALNGYIQRLMAREERIERFKTGFAIVRNSRRIIPREGVILAEAARDGGYGKVEAATRQLLDRTQSFLRQPTEVQTQRMEQAMSTLAESAAGTTLHTQAETLNKHARALLQHHGLTEQRFEDVMRTDLEDRAERVISLLDADHQQSRTKRRYFDYGFWASLGLAVLYWSTLIVQWMGRRRQRKAAARVQETVLVEGSTPPWGMDPALATAGGPGLPLEDAGWAGEGERPVQSRPAGRAQGSARQTSVRQARAGGAPVIGGRAAPTLEERLKARGGAHRTQREDPGREDAREQGTAVTEQPATAAPAPAAEAGVSASGSARPEPTLEERLEALKADLKAQQQRAPGTARRVRYGDSLLDDAEGAGEPGAPAMEGQAATADRDAGASSGDGRASSTLEERLNALKAERDDWRGRHGDSLPGGAEDTAEQGAVRDFPVDAFVGVRPNRPAPEERRRAGIWPPQARARTGAAGIEPGTAAVGARPGEPGGGIPAAREPAGPGGGMFPSMRRPGESGADATAEEYLARERERYGPPPAPASAPGGGAERSDGPRLRIRGREAEAAPAPRLQPDGSELVHQATQDAILGRLREIEQEIRAAADAAEQAEHTRRSPDGEGHGDDVAWVAAAGRMAGARWAVHTLLKEVDRLPVALAAPRGATDLIDVRGLLERQLGALAGEDRKRIDATLVPGAVARGNPRALETATDIIVRHALEGARLHPGGEGYVTLTLVQENDGVHLTCLDHGPEGNGSGDRRSLALAVARGLIEGQDGEMEITPYPRHGTMVRLRLLPARSSMQDG